MTANTADLRRLITEFDGSAEAAKRLEAATNDVRTSIDGQQKAILAFNQANRVQNFQIIESLRLVRSVTSTFSALNQVYQTLVLRQIASTQTTVAQQQAFEGAERFVKSLVRGLDIAGPMNEEVLQGFDDMIAKADQLSSDQLQKLIETYVTIGDEANLSGEELALFNKNLEKLNQLLAEQKTEEAAKQFENLFGVIAAGGTAVGVLGQLALNLAKVKSSGGFGGGAIGGIQGPVKPGGLGAGAPGGAGGIGLIGGTALAITLAEFILKQAGIEKQSGNSDIGFGRLDKITGMVQRNEININNPTFNSQIDLEKSLDIIEAKLKEKQGFGTIQ